MKREMAAASLNLGFDMANLSIADLGMFASVDRNVKLLTLHRAKGREFDAVAVIDLHEGRVPNYRAKTKDEIDEARRLLYVAITRARKLLMYFTDQGSRYGPSRFLLQGELGFRGPE